jgi:hypothetical protein
VRVYVCVCVCVYVCVYTCACIRVRVYVCVYTCACIRVRVYVCVCLNAVFAMEQLTDFAFCCFDLVLEMCWGICHVWFS